MKEKYGVLVVDDSAFMRKTIGVIIEENPNFYVIGKARNGIDAIEKIKRLQPDIITLDIEMPELDGLETLQVIMTEFPIPVVMLSNGAESTLEAFELGAVDFVIKESLIQEKNIEIKKDFYERLFIAAKAKLPKPIVRTEKTMETTLTKKQRSLKKQLILIGSSTGGPSALQTILTRFPADFDIPIVVVQHMPPGFTKPLAERFNNLCQLHVKEAEHNEILQKGTVYIAPAGLQTTIQKLDKDCYTIKLKISSVIETLYKPSVDVTLLSVSHQTKDQLLTVILTGMGDDGLRGCKSVKSHGGTILAESEETCIVYGMPKVVVEAGLVDKQVPLHLMFDRMMDIV
ncbi:protein-glutamate methylesterase/protein-glutamine glutaminase [Alkalihalobacterium bogoriense]|uniref:protein-glutamate methylesterase/protein-glutamine glutaminase n=1 Tax=Alkalihalobacterium bogoriense TaxID=246272 RepID=UPI00047D57EA|nr:chemotaxis response regulator protein-glutamate methylesterase [Alkalihalobacterium bogoriense]